MFDNFLRTFANEKKVNYEKNVEFLEFLFFFLFSYVSHIFPQVSIDTRTQVDLDKLFKILHSNE